MPSPSIPTSMFMSTSSSSSSSSGGEVDVYKLARVMCDGYKVLLADLQCAPTSHESAWLGVDRQRQRILLF